MSITTLLIEKIIHLISLGGYPGITFLMALESMIIPVPSEAVMPFAGFLISTGQFSWLAVIVSSTVGSLIGSSISYMIGYSGGRPFIHKFGKYFFLNVHHLEKTEQFFARRGKLTVFVARFIPIVRHLISIPAGTARMNKANFFLSTLIGAGLWNTFLAYVGFMLGHNWQVLEKYSKVLDLIVILVIVILIVYFFFKRKKK